MERWSWTRWCLQQKGNSEIIGGDKSLWKLVVFPNWHASGSGLGNQTNENEYNVQGKKKIFVSFWENFKIYVNTYSTSQEWFVKKKTLKRKIKLSVIDKNDRSQTVLDLAYFFRPFLLISFLSIRIFTWISSFFANFRTQTIWGPDGSRFILS